MRTTSLWGLAERFHPSIKNTKTFQIAMIFLHLENPTVKNNHQIYCKNWKLWLPGFCFVLCCKNMGTL